MPSPDSSVPLSREVVSLRRGFLPLDGPQRMQEAPKADRSGLAVVGVFGITVLFQLPFFDLWFSFMDEGHMVQFADLRLRGGEFYRDATFYPLPGAFHFLALIFDIFGASIRVSRWLVVFEFALFVALLFFLVRKATSASSATWAWLAVGCFWLYRIWCFPHWQIYSYSTTSLLVLLASATALVVYFETLRRRILMLSGFLFGLGVLCKQDYGAAALVALLACLALFVFSQPRKSRPALTSVLAYFLVPAMGVGALTGLYYWQVGVLGDLLQFTVFNHFIGMGAYTYSEFPSFFPVFGQDLALRTRLGITDFMPGIVMTADWAAVRTHPFYTETAAYDLLLKFFFFAPQALLAAAGLRLWALRHRLRAPLGSQIRLGYLIEFLFFAFGGALVLLVWLNKPQDYIHLAVLYWPLIALGIVMAHGVLAGHRKRGVIVAAVVLLPAVALVGYSGRLVSNLRAEHSVLAPGPRAGVYVKPGEAAMLEAVVEYVEANSQPGDRIAALPYFTVAHFLTQRPAPHRSAYIVWPFPEIPNRDQAIVDAMEETGTDLVLYNFTQFFSFDPVWEHAPVLFAYLVENFEIDRIFSYDTWGYKPAALRRRSPAEQNPGVRVAGPDALDAPVWIEEAGGPPRMVPPESRTGYVRSMLWPFRPAIALKPSSGDRRSVLELSLDVPGGGGRLVTAVGVHPQRWFQLPASWVEFRLAIRTSEGVQTLYQRRLNPTHRIEDRAWFEVDVDLRAWAGQAVSLELSTQTENSHGEDLFFGGWAEPRLIAPDPDLTSDLTPADHLAPASSEDLGVSRRGGLRNPPQAG
jgi:hypothetical protein